MAVILPNSQILGSLEYKRMIDRVTINGIEYAAATGNESMPLELRVVGVKPVLPALYAQYADDFVEKPRYKKSSYWNPAEQFLNGNWLGSGLTPFEKAWEATTVQWEETAMPDNFFPFQKLPESNKSTTTSDMPDAASLGTLMSDLTQSQLNRLLDKLGKAVENRLPIGRIRGKPAFFMVVIDDKDTLSLVSNLTLEEVTKLVPSLRDKPNQPFTRIREILLDE